MSVASPSPLRGRWDCVLYVSECAHISVQVYYRRTSRFQQSCEPTDFCKAEIISSQRTTEPTRRRQKTESGGFNTSPRVSPNAAPLVLLPWGDPMARETRINSTLSGSGDQTVRSDNQLPSSVYRQLEQKRTSSSAQQDLRRGASGTGRINCFSPKRCVCPSIVVS